jgi:hypothetical protein
MDEELGHKENNSNLYSIEKKTISTKLKVFETLHTRARAHIYIYIYIYIYRNCLIIFFRIPAAWVKRGVPPTHRMIASYIIIYTYN